MNKAVEAREVMIGNYVLDTNYPERLAKILRLNGGQSYPITYSYGSVYEYTPDKPGSIIGIPLIEDWLKEFGFDDYGGNIFYREISQNGMRFFVNLDNNCIRLSNDNNFYSSPQLPIRTHFIHQLQNLWTALTATHLTRTEDERK